MCECARPRVCVEVSIDSRLHTVYVLVYLPEHRRVPPLLATLESVRNFTIGMPPLFGGGLKSKIVKNKTLLSMCVYVCVCMSVFYLLRPNQCSRTRRTTNI